MNQCKRFKGLNIVRFFLWGGSALALGILIFLVHSEAIIFRNPLHAKAKSPTGFGVEFVKKECCLFFYDETKDSLYGKKRLVNWGGGPNQRLKSIVCEWTDACYLERILPKKNSMDFVYVNKEGSQAYLSFHDPLFQPGWSIDKKLGVVHSLLRTIQSQQFSINEVIFLMQHKPMKDEHLDFLSPWLLDDAVLN